SRCHPSAPGSDGRPSFTALVSNIDSDTAKYIASSQVQTSRQEMIEHLQQMAESNIRHYMHNRKNVERHRSDKPTQVCWGHTCFGLLERALISLLDGVSEGQFAQVLEQAACEELKITPKITIIVVGKRHHVR
ncbi:hypothetical protein MPER_00875, partial [Moniliophthora perniciosa FA553]